MFLPRVLYKLLWHIACRFYANNNCSPSTLWSPLHAGYSQPPRLWWQWLTLPFDSDLHCQSNLSASAVPLPRFLIRGVGKHSDEMQSEIFAIQLVSLRDDERGAVFTGDAHFPANYWSLKGFQGRLPLLINRRQWARMESNKGKVRRETILYEYIEMLT